MCHLIDDNTNPANIGPRCAELCYSRIRLLCKAQACCCESSGIKHVLPCAAQGLWMRSTTSPAVCWRTAAMAQASWWAASWAHPPSLSLWVRSLSHSSIFFGHNRCQHSFGLPWAESRQQAQLPSQQARQALMGGNDEELWIELLQLYMWGI